MKLPNIGTNKLTINQNTIKSFINPPKPFENIDDKLILKINKFSERKVNCLTKKLEIDEKYYTENNYPEKGYSKFSCTMKNNCGKSEENIFKPGVVKTFLNSDQGKYIKNVNDYNIKESGNVDDDRMLGYTYKAKNQYNLVNNVNMEYSPRKVNMNKWPKYYER